MTAAHQTFSDRDDKLTPEATEMAVGVLVVDDDAIVLSLLRSCLPRWGFTVWTADGGNAALSLYERYRERIDLVLLDVRMPGMDGPETLCELRRLNPDVSCCFMSGHTGKYDTDALLKMGALRLFDKPFDLDALMLSLRTLVGKAHLRRTA